MKIKRYIERKTDFTPAEKLRVAVAVLVDGIPMTKVACLFGVNSGRVAEAVAPISKAVDPDLIEGKLVEPKPLLKVVGNE